MKTAWDYSNLAEAYRKRPDYAPSAIDTICSLSGIPEGGSVCDIGAGIGHLAIPLAERGFEVTAVEPNDAMRSIGRERTRRYPTISWVEGAGEEIPLPDRRFDLVTFGSSFNVTDRERALAETSRLLKEGGWFACIWNHRDLDDPIQAKLEGIIKRHIPAYDYGSRREDQTEIIRASGLFERITPISGEVSHEQQIDDVVEAWRSHATLERQAGALFTRIVDEMEVFLRSLGTSSIAIPYVTRGWAAEAHA